MKELRIEPLKQNAQQVAEFAEASLEELGCSMKVTAKFMVALDEIFANIVNYSGAHEAVIRIDKKDGCVSVDFADDGVPFDPLKKADPDITLDADERDIGGLGIYIVKKSMDNVLYFYEDGKNVLKLMLNAEK